MSCDVFISSLYISTLILKNSTPDDNLNWFFFKEGKKGKKKKEKQEQQQQQQQQHTQVKQCWVNCLVKDSTRLIQ